MSARGGARLSDRAAAAGGSACGESGAGRALGQTVVNAHLGTAGPPPHSPCAAATASGAVTVMRMPLGLAVWVNEARRRLIPALPLSLPASDPRAWLEPGKLVVRTIASC